MRISRKKSRTFFAIFVSRPTSLPIYLTTRVFCWAKVPLFSEYGGEYLGEKVL